MDGRSKRREKDVFSNVAASTWPRCQSVNSRGGLIHLDGLAALVHRFTLVGESLMAAELSGLCEAAVATLALERLLSSVRADVVVERGGAGERPAAVSTFEGSVAGVSHHVIPQL